MIAPPEARVIKAGRLGPQHRHGLSRRQLLTAGGAAVLGTPLLRAGPAYAARTPGTPRPIPGGFEIEGTLFHVVFAGAGEPNTITDFNGFAGVAEVDGHGTGADAGRSFDVDIRFFDGEYVATDGKRYNAHFGFV
ncbi:hypothetical protein ACWEOW_10185 [Monashia sp. NPDC004114]